MATTAAPTVSRSPSVPPRTGPVELAGIALGTMLAVDVLRAWLPALLTIYGDAGSTPAEQIGGFALIWFAGALVAVPVALLVGADRLALAAALALAFTKVATGTVGGGGTRDPRTQLWVLCAALLAALVWLLATAMTIRSGRRAAIGVTAGLGASVALHAALGTLDLTWRDGPLTALAEAGVACAFVGCVAVATANPAFSRRARTESATARAEVASRAGARGGASRAGAGASPPGEGGGASRAGARGTTWLLTGPAVLLTGVVTGATARAEAAGGWSAGVPTAIVAGATLLAVPLAARPKLTRHPVIPAVVLVLAVAGALLPRFRIGGVAGVAPSWTVACQAVGALALGAALGWVGAGVDARAAVSTAPDRSGRRGMAAGLGMVLFVALTFGYYAAYDTDLGFPNLMVPVLAALGVATAALWVGRRARRWGAPADPPWRAGALTATSLAGIAAVLAAQLLTAPARPAPHRVAGFPVRLVTYNIRMGFGLDGRFDPDALATAIRRQRPDLVLLNEVDRGWFVNGGHDDLRLIADRLGMRAVFAPAADQLWGDALLTRLPVLSVRSHPLPADGAVTGAEALAAVLAVGDRELGIVATHLQPPPHAGPAAQARAVAGIAKRLARDDRPVLVAGDLNITPRDAEFGTLLGAGLLDGLAGARPLPTYPADHPDQEIDQVLHTPNLRASDVVSPPGAASDHRPVAVTLTYQDPEELSPTG